MIRVVAGTHCKTGASVFRRCVFPGRQRAAIWMLAAGCILPMAGCDAGARGSLVQFATVCGEQAISAEVDEVRVRTRVGDISIIGGAQECVSVTADVRIRAGHASAVDDQGEFADHVNMVVRGRRLIIEDAHTGQPDHEDWGVSLVVRLPRRLATVDAFSGVGMLRVEGASGIAKLSTGVGGIVLRSPSTAGIVAESGVGGISVTVGDVLGSVKASSGTGDVSLQVTGTPPSKDVHLGTGTGSVDLSLPAGAAGRFRMATGTGSIRVSGHEGVSVKRSLVGGCAEGTVGKGGPTYDISTGTGSIVLR
ncbi:MAG: hypothetical protein ABII12_13755 [Planctomycetota bacterium]